MSGSSLGIVYKAIVEGDGRRSYTEVAVGAGKTPELTTSFRGRGRVGILKDKVMKGMGKS